MIYYCNDSLNNLASKLVLFGIKTIPPQISLNFPNANNYVRNSTVQFNYTPMASDGLSSCELWGNWTGVWHKNDSTASLLNFTSNYFTKTLPQGVYQWNIWCNNTNNFYDWSTQGNITFTVDSNAPYIAFVSPSNISYNSSIINVALTNNSDAFSLWFYNGSTNITYYSPIDYNLPDGSYNYIAYANDSAGNLNQTNISFNVDTSYSSFYNFITNNASFIGNGTGLFNITVNNTNGTVVLVVNNVQMTAVNLSYNVYNDSYYFSTEGVYEYYWISYSNGTSHLLSTSGTNYYTVNETDKISPTITQLIPGNNSYLNNSNVNITVNITDITSQTGDTESGIKNATLFVYNSTNTLINQTTVVNAVAGTLTQTVGIVVTLVDSVYTWFWKIFDFAGNMAITQNKTFEVDAIPPQIIIIAPQNNSVLGSNPINVNYSVSDRNLVSCWYYDAGFSSNVTIENCANASISNLMDGEHNLTIYANDSAGNTNYSSIKIIMDSSPPEVSLNSPEDYYSNESAYEIPVVFNCSATDNLDLNNISLYLSNSLNQTVNFRLP